MTTNTYIDGKVHVRRTRCSTCIFRPADNGRLDGISDVRVAGMIAEADREDSAIACHKTLYQDAPIEPVCAGYFARKSSALLRLAEALDIIEWH